MILPYYLRLLCLCLATFFVVHGVVWLVVRSTVRGGGENRRNDEAAHCVALAVWIADGAGSHDAFLVVGFCVPSYVWLEPHITSETRRMVLLAVWRLPGAAVWIVSLVRGMFRWCAPSVMCAVPAGTPK